MDFLKIIFITVAIFSFVSSEEYSQNEKAALKKFRPMIKSIVYEDYMLTDDYLVPWLRARKLDVGRAKTMLERNLKWRKDNNIDNIMSEDVSGAEQCIKIYHGGNDREGRPVVYGRMGSWDVRKCALAGKIPIMTRLILRNYLEGPARVVRNSKNPKDGSNATQTTSIMDMNGFNLRQGGCLACLPFFGTWAYNYETYYPQSVKNLLFVNAPSSFQVLLDFIKPIITPYTSEAITVFGHNKAEWSKALDKYVDNDNMPAIFGGKRKETNEDRDLY